VSPQPIQDLHQSRSVHFDGMLNARDLGGLQLADGSGVVDCARLLRSASPQLLSEAGAEQLYSYGVRTVVDLRSPGEQLAEGYGPLTAYYDKGLINHLDAPLLTDASWATDPVGTTHAALDPASHYINYLSAGAALARIATALADTAALGAATILHCAFGKDRTGVATAVMLDAIGADHTDIVEDFSLTAHHVPALIERMSGARSYNRDLAKPDLVALAPRPEGIAGMLSWLAINHGGSAAFLASNGVRADVLLGLRRHLRYQRSGR
jgi:protein-tyrosine phosphatase